MNTVDERREERVKRAKKERIIRGEGVGDERRDGREGEREREGGEGEGIPEGEEVSDEETHKRGVFSCEADGVLRERRE